jgi:serine/threonine protein kinase
MVKRSVAIKVLVPQAGITQHRVKLVLEETQISAALKTHPNIVKYYGICVDPPKIMLVFEYCNPGNLYEFMAGCDPEAEVWLLQCCFVGAFASQWCGGVQGFDFSVRLQLASQGAAALAYMHSFESPIIHRDVKVRCHELVLSVSSQRLRRACSRPIFWCRHRRGLWIRGP